MQRGKLSLNLSDSYVAHKPQNMLKLGPHIQRRRQDEAISSSTSRSVLCSNVQYIYCPGKTGDSVFIQSVE